MRHKVCLCDWGMRALVGPVTTDAAVAVSGDIADDLAKAMREIKIEGLTGELTWNDEGQVEKPATAYVIQDGKYIAA